MGRVNTLLIIGQILPKFKVFVKHKILFQLLLLKLKSYESALNNIFGGSFVLKHFRFK